MAVTDAATVEPGDCSGGFGVRGFGFVDGRTLKVCEQVQGTPPRCAGEVLDARLAAMVGEFEQGTEVDASIDFRSGRRTALSVAPSARP